ncbi:MAG TPA: ABC transporter substrate-binding protein [Alphaproteobacteria bacterium]
MFRPFVAALLLLAIVAAAPVPVPAAEPDQNELPTLTIGYVDLEPDVRYDDWGLHPVDIRSATAIVDRHAWAGAELGLADVAQLKRVAKANFALERRTVADAAAAIEAIKGLAADGVSLFVLDLPDAAVAEVAKATRDSGVLLFNATATGDSLRNDDCAPHLFHTAASRAMLMDGLAQFLKAKKWTRVLILQGPLAEDALTASAFKRAAKLFGVAVTETRSFVLGSDPRARELNDLAFLTGNASYDAVMVADADGEFALAVPYDTLQPAAVVGASGLVPRVWHWSYTRHGAPQVHGRFERMHGRRMGEADWGAWVAMKTIGDAVVRTKSLAAADISAYIRGDQMRVDGSKGPGMSFRPWDNQLRQPVLLSSDVWVVANAPIEGFKHRTNDLDTLGYEERDTTCRF